MSPSGAAQPGAIQSGAIQTGVVQSVPRLVSDASRSYVALGITMVGLFVGGFVYGALVGADGDPDDLLHAQLILLIVGYIVMLGSYQVLTWWRFRGVDGETLRAWARATNRKPGNAWLRAASLGLGGRSWSVTAAVLALAVAAAIAGLDIARNDPVIIGSSLVLVAFSWTNVVVASAVAYLREDAARGGLAFPEAETPTWSDLVYLSVQVSTTFSSSDVDVKTRRMRRLVTVHSLVAFVFNTVIVAVLVSALLTLAD